VAAALDQAFAAGMAAVEAQDYAAAEQCFRGIVAARPESHQAWNALAWTYLWWGQPEIGIEYARRASGLDRHNADYLNTLGVAQGELGEFAEAEATFRRVLKLKPGYVGGLVNLAKVLLKQGRIDETVKTYERAYTLAPATPKLASALAQMYRKAGRAEQARALLAKAAGDDEDLAMARAETDSELDGAPSAIAGLRAAVARHPEWRLARLSLSHLCLASGDWCEGWRQYLMRRADRDPRTYAPQPLPARLDGSTVLLRSEQGIGDVLFFLRFAPLLRARGARITLACDARLAGFVPVREPLEAVREAQPGDEGAREFDFALRCGDLPALLETEEVPAALPFEADEARAARARERLAALGPAPYLGVTWRAGTDVLRSREFGNDSRVLMKELPTAELGAALRGFRGTVLALQRNLVPEELGAFSAALGAQAHDLSSVGQDLHELLALLSQLDDYVGVSSTNMHLLAGLGGTARVLLPYPPEWRWMRLDGPSPWFPGFAVYREPRQRGWQPPLEQLRRDLIG
jgi:Tfp pilus assembly protein PilF